MLSRELLTVEVGHAPFVIDPNLVTHAIVLANLHKTNTNLEQFDIIAPLLFAIDRVLWEAVSYSESEGFETHLALSTEDPTPNALIAVLEELEIPETSSVFCRTPHVSLDAGKNRQTVIAATVFTDPTPKLITSDIPAEVTRRYSSIT